MRKLLIFFAFFTMLSLAFLYTPAHAIYVSANSACAIERNSKEVYYNKNANKRMSMASTTKIMTAIIAIENSSLNDNVKITSEAVGIEGSSIYLKEGEQLTMEDLLYALLLESANDAAVAIALYCSGSVEQFVNLMNDKARELGLEDTHFSNPHGLDDENHYTTALDLAKMTAYAIDIPIFSEIVATQKKVIPLGDDGSRVLINHNKLLKLYEGAVGVKTGFTHKSGRCLVSCAERDNTSLICVTLNAPNDWNDHKLLLDHGFSIYKTVNLAEIGDYVIDIPLIGGKKSSVLCSNLDKLSITLKNEPNISARLEANQMLCAPIKQGDYVGRIVFYSDNKEFASLNLYALETVKVKNYKKSFFERIFD